MSFKRIAACLLLAMTGGCATITESNQQVVRVQAISDYREVFGVGCVLANQAGRWFVTAPGSVTIQKSAGYLTVDCKKEGAGYGNEVVASTFATASMIGNVVASAGLGYLVDRRSGAGFDYPATLTVLMRKPGGDEPELAPQGNQVY
jgi:hypothetical protein